MDEIDEISARPDFQILGYPVITMTEPYVHKGSKKYLLGENPSFELIEIFSMEKILMRKHQWLLLCM